MEATKPNKGDILISRIFNAPPKLVFRAWTEPGHLLKWYYPNGCSLHVYSLDLKPGGAAIYSIKNPNYPECIVKASYLEIEPYNRLVFTLGFSDKEGNDMKAADFLKHHDWPDVTTVTLTFEKYEDNKTKLTLYQTVSEALAKETGAYQSWGQMLDKLALELEEMN